MANVMDYLSTAASVSTTTVGITGNITDGASAAGFAAWILAVTGTSPTIVQTQPGYAKMILSQQQVDIMRQWLNKMIFEKPKVPSTFSAELAPVFAPMAFRAAAGYGILALAVGFIAAKWL